MLGRDISYFVKKKNHSDSTKMFINMLEFLIDTIFVIFGGCDLQQTVGIHMDTHCTPLLADLFLSSYEADLLQGLLKKNKKKLTQSFNFTFLSLNNSRFGDFIHRF